MFQQSNDNQNIHQQSSSLMSSPEGKGKGFQSSDMFSYSPFVIKNGCSSSTKAFNFLTEKKRKISNSKIYTPSPNTAKTDKLSDRFIPMNKGINLMEKFNLANRYDELDENCNNSNIDNSINENSVKYNEILKQNVLNENTNTPFKINKCLTNQSKNNIKTKIFTFKSESKPKINFYYFGFYHFLSNFLQ